MATYLGESEASFCIMYIIFACTGAAAQLQGCDDNFKMPIIWGSHFILRLASELLGSHSSL